MRRLRPSTEEGKKPGAYVGFAGLACVLAMTKDPTSPTDVTKTTGIGVKRAAWMLRQFWLLGLVHRCGWIKPKNGFPTPIYQIGDGEDVPAMKGPDGRPHAYADVRPKRMEPRIVAFASVIQAMQSPVSVAELMHQSGVSDSRLRELLWVLNRRDVGLAYIAGYQPREDRAGPQMALWCYGINKRNATRPAPKPRIRMHRNARKEAVCKGGWVNTVLELRRGAGIARPHIHNAGSPA